VGAFDFDLVQEMMNQARRRFGARQHRLKGQILRHLTQNRPRVHRRNSLAAEIFSRSPEKHACDGNPAA